METRAWLSPTWTGGGLRRRMRRPRGVKDSRMPLRSARSTTRRTAPRRSSRSTIPETVEGWAKIRADSSPSERAGSFSRTVSTHTCGPERPVRRRMALEYSWTALNSRRRLLTTSAASWALASDSRRARCGCRTPAGASGRRPRELSSRLPVSGERGGRAGRRPRGLRDHGRGPRGRLTARREPSPPAVARRRGRSGSGTRSWFPRLPPLRRTGGALPAG